MPRSERQSASWGGRSMRVVVIHGPGSREQSPEVVSGELRTALLTGLRAAGRGNADELDIAFSPYGALALEAYFGDPDVRERALAAVRSSLAAKPGPVVL